MLLESLSLRKCQEFIVDATLQTALSACSYSPLLKLELDKLLPLCQHVKSEDTAFERSCTIMRLQVSVRRHGLPAINIIFTTGTGPASKTLEPNSTVSDLLYDVNDLVPLESADGEWGLEDYVVEVQATADQESYYECLHYQTIDSVLREDDEVVIRSLGTEDLRSRRLGGRHQISVDGRHLIDGVPFGRHWLRRGGRPAINIPPRKRRRLEIEEEEEGLDEESTTLLDQLKKLGYSNEDIDDEDEKDDEDYVDKVDENEGDSRSEEEEDNQPLRIKATADLDDSDVEEGEDSSDDNEEDQEEVMAGAGLELSDELKALLAEAEDLLENDTYHRLPSEPAQSPRKRKRGSDGEEDLEPQDASDFEGFSTPTKSKVRFDLPSSSVSSVSKSDDSSDSSESDSDSGSDSGSDSMNDEAATSTDRSSSASSGSGHSSSSGSSSSESDEESTSADSSSDSSSDESTELKKASLPSSLPKQVLSRAHSTSSSSSALSATSSNKQLLVAPGEGLRKTKRNNVRAHKRVRLARLKQDGLLGPNANFADMAMFDEQNKTQPVVETKIESEHEGDLESKRAALLRQLHTSDGAADGTISEGPSLVDNDTSAVGSIMEEPVINTDGAGADKDSPQDKFELDMSGKGSVKDKTTNKENLPLEDTMEADETVSSQEIGAKAQESFIGRATPKSTERRAKLDLASSRRMLFNSLGLRTPKTPEAEQALREKLAQDIRTLPQRSREERSKPEATTEQDDDNDIDTWQDRIVLSAVECEYDGVTLSTPPFPFKQGWDSSANTRRGANKRKGRKDSIHHDGGDDLASAYAPDVSVLQTQDRNTLLENEVHPESRTLSLEEQEADDMPRPPNFQDLIDLRTTDLIAGALIAFKELDIQNFQPVVSHYRVARVQDVQNNGSSDIIELILSKQDWPTSQEQFDPFNIEEEDKQPEDGVRLKSFVDLIEPKLIKASPIQVHATPPETDDVDEASTSLQLQNSTIPESEKVAQDSIAEPKILTMASVEISTPRRNEITAIMKEAGFDSAIDKDLLQVDAEHEADPQSSPAFHTRSHPSQRKSRSPVSAIMRDSITSPKEPHADSAGLHGWDSSALHQVQADSSGIEPSQASRQSLFDNPKPGTQSTVSYPALTHLEIDASGVTVTNDSSFQDAQQVSPPPEIDISALRPDLDTSKLHPEYPYDDYGNDDTQPSLASEVPQSQLSRPSPEAKAGSYTSKSSFLGLGLDGQTSSNEDSDFISDNSSLPSLRELTSSQNNKIKYASRQARVSRPAVRAAKASISPPPARGKRLRNGKKRSTSPQQSESDNGVELSPVNISQSQAPRISQIPIGSQVVDLIFSSSPRKPDSDDDYQAPKTRGGKAKKGKWAQASRGQSNGSLSSEDDEQDASTGIGKRRFLTTKKWTARSHI